MIFKKNVLSVFVSPYPFDIDDITTVVGSPDPANPEVEGVEDLTRESFSAIRNLLRLCGSHVIVRSCGKDRYTFKWKDVETKQRCVSSFKQLYSKFGLHLYDLCAMLWYAPFFLSIYDCETWIAGTLRRTRRAQKQVIALNGRFLWRDGVLYEWQISKRISGGVVDAELLLCEVNSGKTSRYSACFPVDRVMFRENRCDRKEPHKSFNRNKRGGSRT
jgi:hypothetical protein